MAYEDPQNGGYIMNTFLFTQITNTILGVLIVAGLVLLIYKKFKATGVISIVLAFLVFLIGIITPISIVICTIIAITMGVLGAYSLFKYRKKKDMKIS